VALDFFRKVREIIGIKSLSGRRESVVGEFFAEVAHYEQALTQSFVGILGKERAAKVAGDSGPNRPSAQGAMHKE